MNILVIKPNTKDIGVSVMKNGELEIGIIDPSRLDEVYEQIKEVEVNQVIVSKELNEEERKAALSFAFKVTGYENGKLNRVHLI